VTRKEKFWGTIMALLLIASCFIEGLFPHAS